MRRAIPILLAAFAGLAPAPASASNDPWFAQQWSLAVMRTELSWRASVGQGVVVAVVDSGVDLAHPDLAGRLVEGRDFVDGDSVAQDENGHGTHMAGSIAAVAGNGVGIAGIAPESQIMPVRVLDENGHTDDPTVVADGIRWAVDHGARVVNLSLAAEGGVGGGQNLLASKPIDLAIEYATFHGAVVVVAAGNTESGGKPATSYDATAPGALVVGASTKDDKRAAYSNYGAGLDVLAPGGGSATDPSFASGCSSSNGVIGLHYDRRTGGSAYAAACGTSVSVAQVSGIAAQLLSRGLSNRAAVDRILDTARDLGAPGRDNQTGHGRVDGARALGVSGTPLPSESPEPPASTAPTQGVGAAGSATPTPPQATTDPAPSQSPGDGNPTQPPQAAGKPPESASRGGRAVPIAAAAALLFFVAWSFLGALGVIRTRD